MTDKRSLSILVFSLTLSECGDFIMILEWVQVRENGKHFLTCFDQQLVPADVKQRRIKNPVKRLRWNFYVKIVNGFRYSTESVRIRKYSTFLSNPISDKDFKNLNFQIFFGEYYFKIDFQVSSILKRVRKKKCQKNEFVGILVCTSAGLQPKVLFKKSLHRRCFLADICKCFRALEHWLLKLWRRNFPCVDHQ